MILWHLQEEFGFGKKRLMRFYETFSERMKETSEYYLLEENKMPWLYKEKLKAYGIDVSELNKKRGIDIYAGLLYGNFNEWRNIIF